MEDDWLMKKIMGSDMRGRPHKWDGWLDGWCEKSVE